MLGRESSRSNRTGDEMFNLLASQARGELSVKQFCDLHGLSPAKYYYWQKRYKDSLTVGGVEASGFTLLELREPPDEVTKGSLFAEYKGIRFYREPSVELLKQLIA
jgi:hypothetical protein